MSILGVIHQGTKVLHAKTEKKAYLNRYKGPELTLQDHYRHLSQLYPIYVALEEKMQSADMKAAFNLPADFEYFLHRSECIKKDMFLMKQTLGPDTGDVLPATKAYVKQIEASDVTTEQGRIELFSHYLVRILGDLFGGQKLKEYVNNLYSRERLPTSEALSGVSFYEFESDALRCFGIWLNAQTVSDEAKLVAACNDAFAAHISIFDELEATRPGAPRYAGYQAIFFAVAATATTAAVAAATCALTDYCKMNR